MYTDMVNVTDEALVMQIVRLYFPRWDKGEDTGDEIDSEKTHESSSKRSGGAEKGQRLTCSRTARTFYDYCRKVNETRESTFKVMWDERLKCEAIKQHQAEMDEENRSREENGSDNIVDGTSSVFDADVMNGYWGGTFGVDELPPATTQV